MTRFFIALAVTTAAIFGIVQFGTNSGWYPKPSFFSATLILLAFTTAVMFVYLVRANRSGFFVQLYLITMVFKLLAYCGFNLWMILTDRESAVGNVVFFMITYFVFTVLEIAFLYGKISNQNGSRKQA